MIQFTQNTKTAKILPENEKNSPLLSLHAIASRFAAGGIAP